MRLTHKAKFLKEIQDFTTISKVSYLKLVYTKIFNQYLVMCVGWLDDHYTYV